MTINRDHAEENDNVTKEAALALLKTNSAAAAAAIRAFTDEELDRAAPVSLNSDAPLTCQFFLEDHPVRHSYHHLARIKAALGISASARCLLTYDAFLHHCRHRGASRSDLDSPARH